MSICYNYNRSTSAKFCRNIIFWHHKTKNITSSSQQCSVTYCNNNNDKNVPITIEPSDPCIVSKILDHLPYDILKGGTTLFTAPDRILNSYDSGNVTFDPTTSRVVVGLPISWKILGKPDVADLCHTLILLRHKRALHFLPTVWSQICLLSKKTVWGPSFD